MSRTAVAFLVLVAPALSLALACLGLETARQNVLGWVLIALGASYPAGAVIAFWIRRTPFWQAADPGAPVAQEAGDRSFWLILPGALAAFFAPPLETLYLTPILPGGSGMQAVGASVFLLGLGLSLWARSAIRTSYSGHVQVGLTQRLVTHGPYRLIRHPSYAGLMLMGLGVSVGYSSLLGIAAVVALLMPGLAYRIVVEERLLRAHFGAIYDDYAQTTRRLIPRIW